MRLRSEADVQQFLDAVNQCGGDVYLKSPEGDIFNLKSSMSRYIAIGRLIEEQGDTLELFADRKEAQPRPVPRGDDLMRNGAWAPAKGARPDPPGRALSIQWVTCQRTGSRSTGSSRSSCPWPAADPRRSAGSGRSPGPGGT